MSHKLTDGFVSHVYFPPGIIIVDDPVNPDEPISESELAQVRDWIIKTLGVPRSVFYGSRLHEVDEPIIVEGKSDEV